VLWRIAMLNVIGLNGVAPFLPMPCTNWCTLVEKNFSFDNQLEKEKGTEIVFEP